LIVSLGIAAAAAPARQEPPTAQGHDAQSTPAEREWQKITDEIVPKLVRFKGLAPEEKRKETFRAELARIGEFVRQYQASEPFYAASARVFMATQILAPALHRDREAVEVLVEVARGTEDEVLAGVAAVHAGELLLKLGDEGTLRALRDLYAGREKHDPQFLQRLDELCRQVRLQPGRPFPDLPLADLSGLKIEPASLRGRLLVVLVFNVEHEASMAEFEGLAALLAARKDPGLGALGISVDLDPKRLKEEAERLKVAFPIDGSGKGWEGPAVKELGLTGIPATFLVDPKGTILFTRIGPAGPELGPLVDHHLEQLREQGLLPKLTGAK